MYSNTAARASARVRKRTWWTCSFFSEAKKDSMGALSRQLPLRLIDRLMPCRFSTSRYGSAAYWADSSGRRNTGGGWCDGGSAALGSGLAGQAEVAGAASGGAARGPAAGLGGRRGGGVAGGAGG